MTVLLDLGNSRFKGALLSQGALLNVTAEPYERGDRVEIVTRWLRRREAAGRLLVSNVLGDVFEGRLRESCRACGLPEPEFLVTPAEGHGVRVGYTRPEQLGIDRFLALVAARVYHRTPCVVIDCGTAVTIDALDAEGVHRGGLILPGYELSRGSLSAGTALVGGPTSSPGFRLFAVATGDAVHAGALLGLAAAIDRISADMTAALGGDGASILTGGGVHGLESLMRGDYDHDPLLVLKGLAVAAEENACVF